MCQYDVEINTGLDTGGWRHREEAYASVGVCILNAVLICIMLSLSLSLHGTTLL